MSDEFVQCEPPPSRKGRLSHIDRIYKLLNSHPGWWQVARNVHPSRAATIRKGLYMRDADTGVENEYEVVARRNDTARYDIYARKIEEASDDH